MTSFCLTARGHFSLAEGARFVEGFAPAGDTPVSGDGLRLALPIEGDWPTVGLRLRQEGSTVSIEVTGDADPRALADQVARLPSLDVDGTGFPQVGEVDPVVGGLQVTYPGLRPVGFWSPYEAAAWAILAQRVRIVQAAAIKQQLAEHLGTVVEVEGVPILAFPDPQRLLGVRAGRGLPTVKVDRLHAVARAALAGDLDGARLRSLPTDDALTALRRIPGIGPFSAELVLVRGAVAPDVFPVEEQRLHAEMRTAYGLAPDAGVDELAAVADRWRPFRSWSALLLRVSREDRTGEISGSGPAPDQR